MEMTTAKTIAVFAIIFGCFAVLYPKIFHPMILNMFGGSPQNNPSEEILNRVPPHLRRPGGGARGMPQGADDIAQHMRPGPHPGLRAAAEMKKQAGSQGGSGKGMMAVVLPMYAVGIVIYLIYTMTKVFGKGKKEDEKEYMASHFRGKENQERQEGRQPRRQHGQVRPYEESDEEVDEQRQTKQRQKDLERLLMKADKDKICHPSKSKKGNSDFGLDTFLSRNDADVNTITDNEMHQLKKRLLETEAQMTRILAAMDAVSDKVASLPADAEEPKKQKRRVSPDEPSTPEGFAKVADSSPDMDSYEFVNDKKQANSSTDDEVENIRASEMRQRKKRSKGDIKSRPKSEVEKVPEEEEEEVVEEEKTSDKENEAVNEDVADDEYVDEDDDDDEEGDIEYGDDDIAEGLSDGEEVQGSEEDIEHQDVILGDNEDSEEEEEESHPDLRKRKPAKHKAQRDE